MERVTRQTNFERERGHYDDRSFFMPEDTMQSGTPSDAAELFFLLHLVVLE